jgi:hypothetical protein
MKHSGRFLFVALLAGFSAGCGMMFGGSRQSVNVDSSPPAEVAVVQTGMVQSTPTVLSRPRKDNYVLTFEKAGYDQKKLELQRKMRGGILVMDILFTGLIGVVVDAATGAWYKLVPDRVTAVLTKKEGSSSALPETVKVTVSLLESDSPVQGVSVESDAPGVTVRVEREK